MQKLMIFEEIQVEILEIHSIVYFNPYHVGKCLGLTDSAVRKAITKMTTNQAVKLTNSIVKDIHNYKLPPSGRLFLTESGVYKLAFKSNKPNAEAFTNWIADEVLPEIRKTGKYELPTVKQNSITEQSLQHLTALAELNTKAHEEYDYRLYYAEEAIDKHENRLDSHEQQIESLKQSKPQPSKYDFTKLTQEYFRLCHMGTRDFIKWAKKAVIDISTKENVHTNSVYFELYDQLDKSGDLNMWRLALRMDNDCLYRHVRVNDRYVRTDDKIIHNVFDAITKGYMTWGHTELRNKFTKLILDRLAA